jgi:hypothetical protein
VLIGEQTLNKCKLTFFMVVISKTHTVVEICSLAFVTSPTPFSDSDFVSCLLLALLFSKCTGVSLKVILTVFS